MSPALFLFFPSYACAWSERQARIFLLDGAIDNVCHAKLPSGAQRGGACARLRGQLVFCWVFRICQRV